ncbi:Protein SQS1 [Trichoderma ghanense]|uniref:Protein SQS1 n=1 Tax=Trichoderma ghanense TaxID=65468 RepID=A0ABY2HGF9_9HYPO
MGGRSRAFQKQRNGWNQSPRRGQKFGSPSPRNDVTFHSLTLEEEARQTSSYREWSNTVQLRKRPVVFVSSGSHDPLQPLTPQAENAEDASSTVGITEEAAPEEATSQEAPPEEAAPVKATSQEATFEETKPVEPTSKETQPVRATFKEATSEETTLADSTSEETDPVDRTAERTSLVEAKTGEESDEETTLEQTTIRETTPEKENIEQVAYGSTGPEEVVPAEETPGENTNDHPETDNTGSSDEVIVFRGRNAVKAKAEGPSITLTTIQTEIRAVEREISAACEESPKQLPIRPAESDDDNSDDLLWPRRKRGKARGRRNRGKDSEEEAMLADYIANMRENGEMFEGLEEAEDDEDSSEDGEGLPSTSLGPNAVNEAGDGTDDDDDDDDAIDGSDLPDIYDSLFHLSRPGDLKKGDYAEEYDELIVMDWGRPSVSRKKGKGRLPFPTDDLDSDTEEALRTSYNNDRQKKAERKKEREELRAMGLLGKRGQVDLRAKYSTGITMSQVIDEVKTFLAGSQETLTLPPMDPHTRKGVHELSHKLNVKSKSIGGGEQRRPVLYKTKKTSYNEQEFEQIIVRIRRIFGRQPPNKPRQGQKGPKGSKGSKGSRPVARSGGGGLNYYDGEVIGASAPELGTENRGRAMMEKMGWSTGTPLGASDNQGILHPVSQTMKRTRAGLGQE